MMPYRFSRVTSQSYAVMGRVSNVCFVYYDGEEREYGNDVLLFVSS